MEDNKELVKKVFSSIKTKISNDQIMNANYLVEQKGFSYAQAAGSITKIKVKKKENELLEIVPYFIDHFKYLIVTVVLCFIIGVPLGAISAKSKTQ